MFFIPDKIANFTDEVAKSRIKIFQLWRKLLAFTFRFIKTNTLYYVFFQMVSPRGSTKNVGWQNIKKKKKKIEKKTA